jgi:YD repeat-containing protein
MSRRNQKTRLFSYDAAGRLTTQIEQTSGSVPLMTIVDSYDGVGNRTKRVQDGASTTWTYDNGYRLTGQQKVGEWATFVYDAAGNILVKSQQGTSPMTMAFDAANRLVTSVQGAQLITYSYDATGNLTGENASGVLTTYSYDPSNRLTSLKVGAAAPSTYSYEGGGLRRSALESGGVLTTFIWDGNDYLGEYK